MKIISLLLLSFIALASFGQSNPYIHTEPKGDKSLIAFKKQLSIAIEKRDTTLLKPLLGDSILESVNGLCKYCSSAKFLSIECIERKDLPYSNNFWKQAELLLNLGFSQPTAQNPDYYANTVKEGKHLISPPYNYFASLDTVLVLANTLNVYNAPFDTSAVIGKAKATTFATVNSNLADDYDFFIYNQDEDIAYIRIQFTANKIGYIKQENTSQAIYKQITIAKQNGQWKIVSFYHPPGC
jgi:hypothetical protein